MHFVELRLALRTLLRNRFYNLLNLAGLSISLAIVILVAGSIRDELNWDTWSSNRDSIYRLTMQMKSQDGKPCSAFSMPGIAPELKAAVPSVESFTRITWPFEMRVRRDNEPMEMLSTIRLVDPEFLTIFEIPLEFGDPAKALNEPNSCVLSHETAVAWFGTANPIGQPVLVDEENEMVVTGVAAPLPGNTHLPFNMLLPISLFGEETLASWGWMNFGTYLLIPGGADTITDTLPWNEFFYPRVDRTRLEFALQPLSEIHFAGDTVDGIHAGVTTPNKVYGLASIALLVLIIATINFMNLNASLASRRVREVSMLKIIGARRGNLIVQQLAESLLIAFVAGAAALLIAELVLPHYANLLAQPNLAKPLADPAMLALHTGITLLAGLFAGLYAALLFSAHRPSAALKGELAGGIKISRVRRTLVVVQIAISIVFVAGTIVIQQQLAFVSRMSLGFDRENVMLIRGNNEFRAHYDDYLNRFRTHPEVLAATYASGIPGNTIGQTSVLPEGQTDQIALRYFTVEEQALETFGLEMAEGRFFSTDYPFDRLSDSTGNVILNEAAVRSLGLEEPVVGRTMRIGSREFNSTIVGVVKDFNQNSLHSQIEPMMLLVYPNWSNTIALRYRSQDLPRLVDDVTAIWNEMLPAYPPQISFMNDRLNGLYQADRQQATLLKLSSVLAILVASLGLIGLATFAAQRRTKEVGIRKVLGASSLQVTRILTKEFLLLALVANVIAWPVAIVVMRRWLAGYAYHVSFAWWILPAAGLLAAAVVALVTGLIALRTSSLKPVETLRYE